MGQTHGLKSAVLDTNVVVSALLFSGPSHQLVEIWQSGAFNWLASANIIREYTRVLSYPKFRLSETEIHELLREEILPFITAVTVKKIPKVILDDPADDEFLACAKAGQAGAIISGDHHLLALKSYQDIPILSLADFLKGF